jgi:predicted amidohydrolase
MVARGAAAFLVPTNNGLPTGRAHREVALEARRTDAALAAKHALSVIRADVAGAAFGLEAYGCTGIRGPTGQPLADAPALEAGLIIAEIPPDRRPEPPAQTAA